MFMFRKTVIFLAYSIALSAFLFLYYVSFHFQQMDPYPLKAEGLWAYILCLLIAFPIVHIAAHARRTFVELPTLLGPGPTKCLIALVVFVVTPFVNLLFIPWPIGLVVLVRGHVTVADKFFIAGFAILAYFVTCLAWRSTAKPRGSPTIVLLYFWTVYVGETLFAGIYYI